VIRVLLADDHPIVREGLSAVLSAQPDLTIVGAAESAAEAVRLAHDLRPDILLLDLSLPDGSGADVVLPLLADLPHLKILLFTAYDADERILTAVRAGAQGYLLKGASGDEIARAVRAVHAGGSYFAPGAAASLLASLSGHISTAATRGEALTDRERDVLRLVAAGLPNKQIARQLGITERTVKFHLSSILRKLDAASRAQAAVIAIQRGLV
jgi:DNA-binding NarL/FixJ family response regulator